MPAFVGISQCYVSDIELIPTTLNKNDSQYVQKEVESTSGSSLASSHTEQIKLFLNRQHWFGLDSVSHCSNMRQN